MDNYQKEIALRNAGTDEEYLASLGSDALAHQFYEEMGEEDIKDTIKEKGESDGNCKIMYLSNLNGKCNIDCKYTDILAGYVGEDNLLTFLVSSPDDKAQVFVSLFDFNPDVMDLIYEQVCEK